MLVGFDTSDDACVYKLNDEQVLVQTIDFFPPIVDDPYIYGQIAAANSLSDIYAMGAVPTLAMNMLCVPSCLPLKTIQRILEGGCSKVKEAGAILAGGHTIEDNEPKYGMCVSGLCHPDKILTNSGVKAGDALLLTKAIGTGILTTAAKADLAEEDAYNQAIESMVMLNKNAIEVAVNYNLHACTDVTGFGLLGHSYEMAAASGVTIKLFSNELPIFKQVKELAEMQIVPGGSHRNASYLQEHILFSANVTRSMQNIMYDPQTSGGLLLSVPQDSAKGLLKALLPHCPWARIIGSAAAKGSHEIEVE